MWLFSSRSKCDPKEDTIAGHLRELRRRLVAVLIGVILGTVVGWIIYEPLFQVLQRPLLASQHGEGRLTSLNFAGIGTAFSTQLKVSLFVGLVLSLPWTIYQVSAFVWPGLEKRERRIAIVSAGAAMPLFLLGVAIAWYFLPQSIVILTGFAPDFTSTLVNAEVYFDFVLRMMGAFGLAFLLPILMVSLICSGLVSSRSWLRGWRWAVLVAFIFAAVASPSGDLITMTGLGLPIVALYFGAIGVGYAWEYWHVSRFAKKMDRM